MVAPNIDSSTKEERLDYVLNEWRCLHNCEICGKCHVLKGRSEEMLYADYIDGKRSYMDITLEIRSNRSVYDNKLNELITQYVDEKYLAEDGKALDSITI